MSDQARSLRPRRGVPIRTIALVVVGLIVVGALSWAAGRAVDSGPGRSYGSPGLPARPAAADFAPLDRRLVVPEAVMQSLEVPAGSTVSFREDLDRGNGGFDREVGYHLAEPPGAVQRFFPPELARRGWKVIAPGPDPILGERIGDNGFMWEVGVTISPGAGGTNFTVRLEQLEQGE